MSDLTVSIRVHEARLLTLVVVGGSVLAAFACGHGYRRSPQGGQAVKVAPDEQFRVGGYYPKAEAGVAALMDSHLRRWYAEGSLLEVAGNGSVMTLFETNVEGGAVMGPHDDLPEASLAVVYRQVKDRAVVLAVSHDVIDLEHIAHPEAAYLAFGRRAPCLHLDAYL